MDYAHSRPKPISGLQSYINGDVVRDFAVMAKEVIEKAFKDSGPEHRAQLLEEVVADFNQKYARKLVKFPGATFRLAIIAAHNGRCQMCGQARLRMVTSDAGEKLCDNCIRELEDEVNLGIKIRPPREPEGGTDWMKEEVVVNPDEPDEPEKSLVRAGKAIEAIKHYRERTGKGLKESKDAVEAWAQAKLGGWPPAQGQP